MKKEYIKPKFDIEIITAVNHFAASGNFSMGDFNNPNDGSGNWIW